MLKTFLGLLLCSTVIAPSAHAGEALVPELFSPGIISGPANDGSPTFAPDGNTLYFTRSTAGWGAILESHKRGGVWSKARLASFSGEWNDSSPGMAPDGKSLIFVSTRPPDWAANPRSTARRISNLYRVQRAAAGWSAPEQLPPAVNRGPSIWKPSIASDGTLYFVSIDEKGGKRLYASALKDGVYQEAQPLSFSDGTTSDVDPEIAPDGSFLVFCSAGRMKNNPKDHLYITMRVGDRWNEWGPVQEIRYAGDDKGDFSTDDEPHLGKGGRTLYFSSDRGVRIEFPRTHEQAKRDLERLELWDNSNSNVWMLPLDSWLKHG